MAFITLVAVGADYNLLLMSRVRDELTPRSVDGARTGRRTSVAIVRAVTATGGVITTAGAVFALTMSTMALSGTGDLAQVGFTIGVGLLIDAFIVRAITIPAVTAILGRWNWFPRMKAGTDRVPAVSS